MFCAAPIRERGTISGIMHSILIGFHSLAVLFFVGLLGSSIVIAISFVEDLHELFGKEK